VNVLFGELEKLPTLLAVGRERPKGPARPFIYVNMPINLSAIPEDHEYYRMEREAKLNIWSIPAPHSTICIHV